MGERNSSQMGAQSGHTTGTQTPCATNAIWPPLGWPMFACILRHSGTATSPCPTQTGKQTVLTYKVHCLEHNAYSLEIHLGTMHHNGEVNLNPALAIHFSGQEDWSRTDTHFDVYAYGRKLPQDRQMHLRAILAITYLISRIDRGLTPNIKKTLALYRLLPPN